MISTISTLPAVPNRNDPTTFSDKADALLGSMPTLVTELNNFVTEVNTLSFKSACKCATTTAITLSGAQTIDGQNVVSGDRVLVKNQGNASQNGIYTANNSTWTRATDMDTAAEVAGSFVPITFGVVNGGKIFYTTFNATGGTIGTTAIPWNSLTEGTITGVGVIAPANGGTGLASYGVGDLIYSTAATTLTNLPAAASGNVLKSGTAPSWGKVALASDVSGTLPVANGGTGQATLSSNSVILGNGTSGVQTVAPGTTGNVLTSSGGTWVSSSPPSGGAFLTANTTTWTAPAGVTAVKITAVGGGGGGGGSLSNSSGSAQGGNGATCIAVVSVTPGTTYIVTVGSGGIGVNNNYTNGTGGTGATGGETWFGVSSGSKLVSCTGGTGSSVTWTFYPASTDNCNNPIPAYYLTTGNANGTNGTATSTGTIIRIDNSWNAINSINLAARVFGGSNLFVATDITTAQVWNNNSIYVPGVGARSAYGASNTTRASGAVSGVMLIEW